MKYWKRMVENKKKEQLKYKIISDVRILECLS